MPTPTLKKKGYLPVGYKLLFSYVVLIIIPVIIIGWISHSIYVDSIRKQTTVNIKGTLQQIRDNIEYKTSDITRLSNMLYFDYSLAIQLRSFEEGWESYEKTTKYVLPKLENALNSTGMKMLLSVFFQNESLPEIYRGTFDMENADLVGQNFNMYHLKRIEHKPWYKDFPREHYGSTMEWKQVEQDAHYGRISLLRRLVDTTDPIQLREIGFMRITIQLQDLFQSVDYHKFGAGSLLVVKDDKDRIIYQSGAVSPMEMDAQQIADKYLTIQENIEGEPWQLTAFVPTTIIEQDSMRVRTFTILVCLFCLVVFTFAGMFVSRYFSVRVNKVVSVLNAFREGDFHKRMSYQGKDEFSQISTAINEMGDNIESLIKEVYLTHIQKKEAELETLQSQINPHSLYNTLSSINRLAKFGEIDKLQQMVLGLAKFYRLTLNEGRTMIPVSTEIEQAKAYLEIQRIKHGDTMDVMYDIDPHVWGYETVKLVLQPFIENVLEHARFGDQIHIRIVARKEGEDILFQVIDDGVGMTQERIHHIFHPQEHVNAGFGIRNVDERIKLHFGERYGVTIHSRRGMGTSVRIRIPAKRFNFRGN